MVTHYVPPISVTSKRLILDNEKLRRANAKVTTATAYKYGDLLTLSDTNVLAHATDEKTWDVICGQDVTAAEATIKAADGIEIPAYGVMNSFLNSSLFHNAAHTKPDMIAFLASPPSAAN